MATNYNPRIVTDGLVLALDAGNTKSYPGSGTTWTDLSGSGNTGTLTNGPTYSSSNGGSIVFDGVDDYVTSFPSQLSGTGSNTINVWFRTTSTSRFGLCGIRGGAPTGWVFTINRTTAGNLTYFHTGGSILEVAAGITTNTWYCATSTYNVSSATATLYLNGNQIGSPLSSFTAISSSTFNGVVGAEDYIFSNKLVGNIAQVQIYNRALTAAEIQQNFNALRGRFGI